jgi:ABC-type transporter Mla subunit MlaD
MYKCIFILLFIVIGCHKNNSYQIMIHTENNPALSIGSIVLSNGVQIGHVVSIDLKQTVEIVIEINNNICIDKTEIATFGRDGDIIANRVIRLKSSKSDCLKAGSILYMPNK